MGLLDGFEKLINEHGSATILKERIALANDKYLALEKELSASKLRETESRTREDDLAAENQSLKLDNEKLRQEIQRRDDISEKEKSHNNLLDDSKLEILKLLFKQPKLPKEQIAHLLNVGLPVAEFHLTELKESKMVKRVIGGSAMRPENGWSLDQEGTRYLIENKIIA